MSNPAPVRSTTTSASWAATIVRRKRCPALPDVPPRPPSRRDSLNRVRDDCIAGTRPKTMPVASVTIDVTSRTVPFTPTPSIRGKSDGATARRIRNPPTASSTPAMPPISDRRTLSVSNCRMSLPPLAPNAMRTVTSLSRTAARDRSKFATFAHAISNTAATAPSMIQSVVRSVCPTTCSGSGTMYTP
jgi:hypothetical protein